jgi:hypothetical protein
VGLGRGVVRARCRDRHGEGHIQEVVVRVGGTLLSRR